MRRDEIINRLVEKNGYESYLEIGVDNPNNCFNRINCKNKTGVDPVKGGAFIGTSDVFFDKNNERFDIIFIDGLHTKEQFCRDVKNSLKCLNPGGAIVAHDVFPVNEMQQAVPRKTRAWTGDVWRGWAKLRATMRSIKMFTIDTDHGVGIIKKGKQALYTGVYETYEDFVENKQSILNLKSVDEFK